MSIETLLNDAATAARALSDENARLVAQAKFQRELIESLQTRTKAAAKLSFEPSGEEVFTHEFARSTLVSRVTYCVSSFELFIQFRGGGECRYDKVRYGAYEDLMQARSLGSHFNKHIRDKYPCTKI